MSVLNRLEMDEIDNLLHAALCSYTCEGLVLRAMLVDSCKQETDLNWTYMLPLRSLLVSVLCVPGGLTL